MPNCLVLRLWILKTMNSRVVLMHTALSDVHFLREMKGPKGQWLRLWCCPWLKLQKASTQHSHACHQIKNDHHLLDRKKQLQGFKQADKVNNSKAIAPLYRWPFAFSYLIAIVSNISGKKSLARIKREFTLQTRAFGIAQQH